MGHRHTESHGLQKVALGLLSLMLLSLPWLLGGQILEVQIASLLVATTAAILALLTGGRSLKLPLILLFCLCVYVLIQYANPAFVQEWQTGLRIWNLKPLDHINWLPSSIDSDFTDSSPLRFLILSLTAILGGLALFRIPGNFSKRWLLPCLVINAAVIALVGLIQLNLGSRSILGIFDAMDEGLGLFFGTLLYKNHAAAYFNLGLAASLSCFFSFRRGSAQRRSNPSWLFLIAAAVLLAGVIFSRSRFGFICSLGIVAVFASLLVRSALRSGITKGRLILLGAGVVAIVLGGGFYLFKAEGAKHLKTLNEEITQDFSYRQRIIAYQGELKMFAEKPLFGWGAGNYRHGFRMFQDMDREKEELRNPYMERNRLNFFWQHAHNDYLEWLIELGVLGTLILFSIPGYFAWLIWRSKRWKQPATLMLLAGLAGILVHALVDFPFRNPAVLVTWSALLAIAATTSKRKRESGRGDPLTQNNHN
jgi:O-antigen ligase